MANPLAGLPLFNAIATAGKTLYDVAQGVSNLDTKRQLMEVYDTLMNLKREASDLEDENHELKERLRFKGDEFEFRNPFWFEKRHPDRPLCPRCFANEKAAPMGEAYRAAAGMMRKCLVCENHIFV
jgi:hypothetical protein